MHSTRRTLLGGVALIALAGCTEDDHGDPDGNGNGEDPDGNGEDLEATVEVVSNAFEPAMLAVDPGATVEWTLESGSHTVTLYHEDNGTEHRAPEDAEPFDHPLDDGSFTHTFDRTGVYDYRCTPHEGGGMVGTIVVGEPDPDEPGLSEPGEELPDAAREAIRELNDDVRREAGIEVEDDGEDDDDNGEDDDGYGY